MSSRGHSKNETKILAPPYNEIVEIIIIAISEWLNELDSTKLKFE